MLGKLETRQLGGAEGGRVPRANMNRLLQVDGSKFNFQYELIQHLWHHFRARVWRAVEERFDAIPLALEVMPWRPAATV